MLRRVCLGVKDPRATIRRGMVDLAGVQVGEVEHLTIIGGAQWLPEVDLRGDPQMLKGFPGCWR